MSRPGADVLAVAGGGPRADGHRVRRPAARRPDAATGLPGLSRARPGLGSPAVPADVDPRRGRGALRPRPRPLRGRARPPGRRPRSTPRARWRGWSSRPPSSAASPATASGRRCARRLADDGVALDAAVATDDPTTLALAEVDAEGGARYRFYERATSAPGLEPDVALAALPPSVAILHVGSLGLALEPVATALEAVVERLAGVALVALDPNVRAGVVADPGAYRARLGRHAGPDRPREGQRGGPRLARPRPRRRTTPRARCWTAGRPPCC